MDKKFIFFDIDGTLTDKKTGKVVPSALTCIQKLKDNGHFVAIASGRALYKTKPMMDICNIDHLICNGGAAIVINREVIENHPLDRLKAIALCKEAEDKGYGVLVAVDDSIKVVMRNDLFLKQMGERLEPTIYEYTNLEYESFPNFFKIYISIKKEEEKNLSLIHSLGNLRFAGDYIMYQHDKKNEGIQRVLDIMNASDNQVVVFGDDTNDLIMFQDQWFKIAMGNACEELKNKADFVTKDNIDDGILYACKTFGWI